MRSVAGQKVFRSSAEGILSGFLVYCLGNVWRDGCLIRWIKSAIIDDNRSKTTVIDCNQPKGCSRTLSPFSLE